MILLDFYKTRHYEFTLEYFHKFQFTSLNNIIPDKNLDYFA